MERFDELCDVVVREAVVDRLAVTPRVHQAFLAQLRQVLGQRRLAEPGGFHQRAGGSLAIDEVAQHRQPRLVRQHFQHRRGLAGIAAHGFAVFFGQHFHVPIFQFLLN